MITVPLVDATEHHHDVLPTHLAGERGGIAGADRAGRPPLVMEVGDRSWTYTPVDGGIDVREGDHGGEGSTTITLTPVGFSDLVQQVRTMISLMLAEELVFTAGDPLAVIEWEPALRCLYAGVPIYDPDRAALHEPGLLERTFTLDDDDDAVRAHLHTVGVVRIRGAFSADEIAALDAEVDRLAAAATPDDDRSWWATTDAGDEVLCRLIYTNQRSELIGGLEDDPRLRRLAALVRPDLVPMGDRMEGNAVLFKPAGNLAGLANIPWHQDCGLGGHPWMCPATGLGIQLTGSSPETGVFEAIAGSHGQTAHQFSDHELEGLPHLTVPTEPGDVTVHITDLVHASPAPTGDGSRPERRTLYVSFYNPALAEVVGPGEALNDIIRGRQRDADALYGQAFTD